ncbi:hypothetical protein CapIbe_008215 [Capra ibex]
MVTKQQVLSSGEGNQERRVEEKDPTPGHPGDHPTQKTSSELKLACKYQKDVRGSQESQWTNHRQLWTARRLHTAAQMCCFPAIRMDG